MIQPYYDHAGITIYCADNRDVLPQLPQVGCVITDPPYSDRTHAGHNASARGHAGFGRDSARRAALGYSALSPEDAELFGSQLSRARACSGWVVVMCDHVLAPAWERGMASDGRRYVFAPLPFVAPGSRVRLSGDGPSSWTIWIVVARTKAQATWGTLPGAYVAGEGWREREHTGGKPTRLMTALVGDYSRKSDTILDPFMGSGTTLVAAKQLGRKAIGIEIEEQYCEIAVKRLAQEVLPLQAEPEPAQTSLLE
jgi:site-specific DNA-methyltransferase (adenine-specific)